MTEALLPVLGGVAQGLGSYFGASSAANAAKQAAALQQQRYNEAMSYATPYITSGTNALNQYNTALGLNGTDAQTAWSNNLTNNSAFTAATNYGTSQLKAQLAAQGQTMSGNESSALSDYLQKNLLGYQQSTLDNLYREAGLGSSAANSALSASTSSANNQGNYLTQGGTYTGQGYASLGNTAAGAAANYGKYYYG